MSRAEQLRVRDYLEHIVQTIANMYTSGVTFEGYLADRKTQDAVVRNFEVIGEACNNVSKHDEASTKSHPEVPWGFA